ncbi:MAG: ribosome-associated translation inhibitor RaiA [Microbacteriaceae bacterium]|nr:ribosome-associated translation inhibitor RaiA [Microbacteriaceae bacterium]
MEITLSAKNSEVTDRFRSYVEDKAGRITKLADRAERLEVKVVKNTSKQNSTDQEKVELTLYVPGAIARAEAAEHEMFASFDLALDRLVNRIKKASDRRKVHRGGGHKLQGLHDISAAAFKDVGLTPVSAEAFGAVSPESISGEVEAEEDWSPVVIRKKVFEPSSLTAAQAVDHMELVGHDFFLFIDAETDRPSVVYRRKGWDYGVISLNTD